MGTQITFRRGSSFPTAGSGITLAEPVFETTLHTFHIGLGYGVTAEWVGAPISGLSADIGAGITYKIPTAASVLNYISGLCFGITNGVRADAANTFTALQSFSSGISASGITVNGNMSVTGNFTVSGGVTFTTSETVLIEDNIITLNSNVTGSPSENAGIEIERGTSANVQLLWNESSDRWTFTNDGSTYYDLPTSVVTSFNGNTGAVTGASLGANTFTGLNTFTAGLCASGATLSGSVRFLGTSSKSISTTQAPLIISGTSSGPIAQATNSIRFGVEQTDPLTITSITGVVNISTDNPTLPLQPALKFNTDDLDIIGSGSIKVEPNGYATGNRTQYLQDASGTLALTSQLMGAVNGSTAATTAVTSFNGRTGAVQGVSSAAAGTGISVSAATGAITITNIGVQSFNGNTGAVTGASLGANTFTGLNTFTAGLCAAGITVSGDIRFSGTSAKTISSNQATLTIAGVSTSPILVGSNSVVMGVQVTDSLTLNSATSIVDISTTTSGAYPSIPSIRILTDDADTIGPGSIKIIPASYATANRTQYLQDADGTLALTSQLMGAVNGSTAATTAVTSFNGLTGAVQGVSSFNGLTGAVGGVCAAQANTFTALQTFNSGISASGGTFASDITVSGINAVRIGVGPGNIGSNVCLGGGAFAVNTTGATNVAVGASSLAANTTGSSNVAVGRRSLFVATNGSGNVSIGSTTLSALVNGSNNIGVGRQAADSISAATGGIYIGYLTVGTNSATNEIVIGTQASGFGSNTAVIGATAQTAAYIYGLVNAMGGVSAPGGTFSSLTQFTAGISAAGGVTFSGTIASDTGYRITSNAINAQTGTTYTFLSSDNGKVVTFNNGSTTTVTIPTGLPVGFNCTAIQLGAGQVGFTAASGVTMNAYASAYKISGQHGAAALVSYTTNIFNLSGTLSV